MMKFKNHVFFMLGLASVFSMGTFDAMAKACNKKNVEAGKWCIEGGSEQDCRAGCYCVGANKKKGISLWVDVAKFCRESTNVNAYSEQGVYKCPDGKTSNTKAKTISDCYDVQTSSSESTNCTYAPAAGRYCKYKGGQPLCEPGCYCPGGNTSAVGNNGSYERQVTSRCADHGASAESYLAARSIHYCPDDFPDSDSGTSKIDNCYFKDGSKKVKYGDANISVPAGKYLPKQKKDPATCPAGKYCPGGSFKPSAVEDKGAYDCSGSGAVVSSDKASCVITCSPGYYFAKSTQACKDCHTLENSKKYCPDTTTVTLQIANASYEDKGIYTCNNGYIANASRTDCIESVVECTAGKYLKKNTETPSTCQAGYYCEGGSFSYSALQDQGIEPCTGNTKSSSGQSQCTQCPSNKIANTTHTACVDPDDPDADEELGDIIVDAGYYLPSGKTKHSEQRLCYGVSNFCPGGVFSTEDFDQGIYECPGNGRAANDKKSCNVSLGKEDLRSGVSRASECWLLTDRDDFMECVFGGELYNVSNSNSNTNAAASATLPANHTQYEHRDDDFVEENPRSMRVDNGGTSGFADTAKDKPDYVSKEPVAQKKITNNTTQPLGITTAAKVEGASASFNAARSVRKR